jgi:23S rRNA pseudouridine1911/1915/1917 synthase
MQETALTVLYQDNHLIAVYKPPGLLTQGDRSGDPNLLDIVKAWLARTYDKPGRVYLGLLHRLDRQACGVVVFARTSKAAARMSRLFRERRIEKTYRAELQGQLRPASGQLEHFYPSNETGLPPFRLRTRASGEKDKHARLSYRTLRANVRATIVEVQLETGRKHQIRAQFAAVGHPIAGDRRYGATRSFAAPGIALVALRIAFEHPITKQPLTIELPESLCSIESLPTASNRQRPLR